MKPHLIVTEQIGSSVQEGTFCCNALVNFQGQFQYLQGPFESNGWKAPQNFEELLRKLCFHSKMATYTFVEVQGIASVFFTH